MDGKYRTNSHSKFLIKFHFVFAVKYRKKLLVGHINDFVLQTIFDICNENGYRIDQMQSDVDHIHILTDTDPKVSSLDIAHKLKQITTYRLYQKYRFELKQHFWKENTFWSDGYFVCTTGNASAETIRKYIAEQG